MDIREQMFDEMNDKILFNLANEYALEYADHSLDRNVYPTVEAIKALKIFDEDLPEHPDKPVEILSQIHKTDKTGMGCYIHLKCQDGEGSQN